MKNKKIHTFKKKYIQKGEITLIGSRPARGKTSFAYNLAQSCLDSNEGVVIFSFEMPQQQTIKRILSANNLIPMKRIRKSDLSKDEEDRLTLSQEVLENKKIYIYDDALNTQQLKNKLKSLITQDKSISLCIIDYLQLIPHRNTIDMKLAHHRTIRTLNLLAQELNISIIILSQLNRALEHRDNKRPIISDIFVTKTSNS